MRIVESKKPTIQVLLVHTKKAHVCRKESLRKESVTHYLSRSMKRWERIAKVVYPVTIRPRTKRCSHSAPEAEWANRTSLKELEVPRSISQCETPLSALWSSLSLKLIKANSQKLWAETAQKLCQGNMLTLTSRLTCHRNIKSWSRRISTTRKRPILLKLEKSTKLKISQVAIFLAKRAQLLEN